jgi:glyoxylase-like metal-dependent hydrolase (beta-lactamase superfamily II)
VTHLIYSHHHADHVGAASLFDGNVARIGHEETRRLLLRDDDPARPPNEETFHDQANLVIGGEHINLAWDGSNHSPDNIFIHLPDHDTLMLIDIVNPGWAPVYVSNLTEDIPGYIEAPANALGYSWTHFVGGHLGRLGTRDDLTVHQQYMADISENSSHRHRRSHALLREVRRERMGGGEGLPRRGHGGRRRTRDREVHRCARGRGRVHGEHDVLGDGVDPPRPRLRLAGASLMPSLPVGGPVGDHLPAPNEGGARSDRLPTVRVQGIRSRVGRTGYRGVRRPRTESAVSPQSGAGVAIVEPSARR